MTWVIAVANQKGGVGKTTSVINLAAILSLLHGLRVLVIDMDPQGHVGLSLGLDSGDHSHTLAAALLGARRLDEIIRETGVQGLRVAPSNESLAVAEDRLARQPGREAVLASVMEPELGGYDMVIIDTPPSLGVLTFNALYASSHVLIPIQPRLYSIDGLRRLYQVVSLMRSRLSRRIEILGHFLTMVDNRYRVTKEVRSDLKLRLGDELLPVEIPLSVKAEEGHFHRKPLILYAPDAGPTRAYMALADAVLARLRGEVIRGGSIGNSSSAGMGGL